MKCYEMLGGHLNNKVTLFLQSLFRPKIPKLLKNTPLMYLAITGHMNWVPINEGVLLFMIIFLHEINV